MRALAEAGSPAPVVFLSMHDDEDTIAEAFRCGGRGYVLKSQMARDLGSALDQVRHGRLFAPSLESLFRLANGPGPQHAMQLYGAPASFLDGLAAVFDMALRRGDATCLIASGSELRDGLAARLHDRGWDVGEPSGHRRYRVIDAADALNGCMRNGRPDAQLLANAMAELEEYRAAVTNGAMGRLTVAGNMVAPLIAEGNLDAVLAIERLWNSLTQGLPVLTVCGYHTSCFHDDAPDLWSRVCTQHWAVSQSGDAGYSRQIPWS
jgi:hypothetical protein